MYPDRNERVGTREGTGRGHRKRAQTDVRTSRCVSQSSTPGTRSCGKRPEIRNGARNGPRNER